MTRLALLLAGLGIVGGVGAQTPEPMPRSEMVIATEEYCEALNMATPVCARLSGIVFSRTGDGALRWAESNSVPSGGGVISMLSPVVGAGDYSCMSLNFSPPLPADLDIFFYWTPGRGGGSDSSHMQLFVAPPEGHVPMATMDETANFIQRSADGFGIWTRALAGKVNAPIPELKWCYFGANPEPVNLDRGRIDLLRLNALSSVTERTVIERYCTALNIPDEQCMGISRIGFASPFRLEDLTWDSAQAGSPPAGGGVSVASPMIGSEYSCMSVYFDPPLSVGQEFSFEWDLNRQSNTGLSALLRFYIYGPGEGDDQPPIDNDGFQSSNVNRSLASVPTSGGFAGWSRSKGTLDKETEELRWCYFGSNSVVGDRDLGRIDRLILGSGDKESISEPVVLAGYCEALSMSDQFCDRLSGIVFSGTQLGRLPWDEYHAEAPPGGGGRSVLSPSVMGGNYSCMSLRFDPPLPADLGVSFAWSVGRDGVAEGDTRTSRLQLFVAPPDDHDPALATTDDTSDFIDRMADGFGAWTPYSVPGFNALAPELESVPELKWCYFGADTSAGADDRGRIDRLRLIVASSLEDRRVVAPYCAALSVPDEQCNFLRRVSFERSDKGAERWQATGKRALSALAIAEGQYNCMSFHFDPPIFRGTSLNFEWFVDRSNSSKPNRGQFWLDPDPMPVPEFDESGNSIESTDRAIKNFAIQIRSDVAELKWCFFGGNPSPLLTDALWVRGLNLSIDGVSFESRDEIDEYCSALNMPALSCERLESIVFTAPGQELATLYGGNLVWDPSASAAPEGGDRAVAARFSNPYDVACMSLNFAPPWSAGTGIEFWWDSQQLESEPAGGLQVWLNPGRFHNPLSIDQNDPHIFPRDSSQTSWRTHRWREFGHPIDGVKWCYFFGNNALGGAVDRLAFGPDSSEETISDTQLLGEYCEALNISDSLCARVSGIVFSRTGIGVLRWGQNSFSVPTGGGDRSVFSPIVNQHDYSCISLNFSPPLPADLNISFHWAPGHSSNDSHMQLFVAPPDDHVPMATMDETDTFIQSEGVANFGSWTQTLAGKVDAAIVAEIPALKWCYFGASDRPLAMDRGRIDLLRLSAFSSVTERLEIAQYCTALNISEDRCMGISRIGFISPFRLTDLTWDPTHAGSPPAGAGVSVASPLIGSEYSCMSIYLQQPLPMGSEVSFEWDLDRQSNTRLSTLLRFYLYGPDEGGDEQPPIDNDGFQPSTVFRLLLSVPRSGGFAGWGAVRRTLSEAAGELRWCYFGSSSVVGERDLGRIDRLVFGPAGTVDDGSISDTAALAEYCAALSMPDRLCGQLSGIVFSGTRVSRLPWDENHAEAPLGGGDRSVISQAVNAGNYSCMSLRFDPPIAMYSVLSFDWSVGRDGGTTGAGRLQLFVAPPDDHDPSLAITGGNGDFIERVEDGFSAWTTHLLPRFSAPVPELKWCYFGADTSRGSKDSGRIDRLRLNVVNSIERMDRPEVIAEYCTALNISEDRCMGISRIGFASPFRLDNFAWDSTHDGSPPAGGGISVASPMVSNGEYSCLSLYFDPPLPSGQEISFEWDLNREGRSATQFAYLRFYRVAAGDADDQGPIGSNGRIASSNAFRELGHGLPSGWDGWGVVRRTLGEATEALRWCYFGANATAGARDQGRIDRLVLGPAGNGSEERIAESAVLADYCAALSMSARLCEQLSGIVFSGTEVPRLPWDENHAVAPSGGGDRSVISQAVDENNYSCMSLRFDPPIPMNSDVYFDWSVGRAGVAAGDTRVSRLQLFVAPPADHDPSLATTDGTADFIERLEDGFSAWTTHLLPRVSAPIPELKWCYFGADITEFAGDRGRIDRLGLIVQSSVERSDRPQEIAEYCTALNVPEAQCARISRLGFASPLGEDLLWDNAHAAGAPAGGGISVASPMISNREYSCMSVYLVPPVPPGENIAFDWDISQEMGSGQARLLAWRFAPGAGNQHIPLKTDSEATDYSLAEGDEPAGFQGWIRQNFRDLSEETGELKWCYFGANPTAGAQDLARVDRLVFGPADNSNEEHFSDPAVLAEYCAALNMSDPLCERLSGIVFSGTEVARLPWDDNHGEAPSGGGARSVLSPAVHAGSYSCMSLRFDPAIPADLNVLFDWAVGRDGDSGTARLQLFVAPPDDHDPLSASTTDTGRFIERVTDNFSAWMQAAVRTNDAVPELKWCYFGADNSPGVGDSGRIDRLRLNAFSTTAARTVIDRYCTALNVPGAQCRQISHLGFAGPARLDNLAWDSEHAVGAPDSGGDRSVLSPPVAVGEYSCMSLYFDPPLPVGRDIVFEWDISGGTTVGLEAVLRFYVFTPGEGYDHVVGDGRPSTIFRNLQAGASGFAGWGRRSKHLTDATGELKWCYSGRNSTAGEQDVARIDRLLLRVDSKSLSERAILKEYCAALNMSVDLCAQLSRMIFFKTGFGGTVWDDLHAASSMEGDTRSVASPVVAAGNYSCMSLNFSPPIAANADISFAWSLGRSGEGTAAQLQLFVAPPFGGVPMAATGETGDFIRQSEEGFGAWMQAAVRSDEPVPELKWCYFGVNTTPNVEDIGRIDRLSIRVDSESFSEPAVLQEYCATLDMSRPLCDRLSSVDFVKTGPGGHIWKHSLTEALSGDSRAVVSPIVAAGDYSCMSLQFAPSLPADSAVSFSWSLGRGGGSGSSRLQLFVNPPLGRVPMATTTDTAGFIEQSEEGFGAWMHHAARSDDPISELKWCYFGANPSSVTEDRGRLDALRLQVSRVSDERMVLARYCIALNVPAAQCASISRIGFASPFAAVNLPWSSIHTEGAPAGGGVSVLSPMVSNSEYSCMSVYFDAPVPMGEDIAFDWDVSREMGSGQARLLAWRFGPGAGDAHIPLKTDSEASDYSFADGGDPAGFRGWERQRFSDLSEAVGELKWCYFGANDTAGEQDRGRIDRLVFGSAAASSSEVRFAEPAVLAEYCVALDMSDLLCERLFGIAFSGTEVARLPWDDRHGNAPAGGGDRSVLSPAVAAGDYSCMSMNFSPALPADVNISFYWAPGRGNSTATDSSQLQLFLNPPTDRVPMATTDETAAFIQRSQNGFGDWTQYSARNIAGPISQLKWCYFGADGVVDDDARGRIDRLGLIVFSSTENRTVIDRYCTALDVPEAQCERIGRLGFSGTGGDLRWDSEHAVGAPAGGGAAVVSPMISDSEYSCMSIYFDAPVPAGEDIAFDWDISQEMGSGQARLLAWRFAPGAGDEHIPLKTDSEATDYSLAENGDPAGFRGWKRQRFRDLSEAVGELKWCYFGTNDTAGSRDRDRGRIDRLVFGPAAASGTEERFAEPAVLAQYCDALNISASVCARLSGIVFSGTRVARLPWDDKHEDAPTNGGGRSVLSPVVAAGDYSCMSLNFSPVLPADLNISFHWAPGRGNSTGTNSSQLQLFLNPPPGRVPLATTDETADFIRQSEVGFSTWTRTLVGKIDVPIAELKWCYFGANEVTDDGDRGRIDLLRLHASTSVMEPTVIELYCTALNVPEQQCSGISRLGFSGPLRLEELAWDSAHLGGAPAGGGISVASPMIAGREEYSCMSIYFDPPLPAGRRIGFEWDISREHGSGFTFLRFYRYALDEGDEQPAISSNFAFSTAVRSMSSTSTNGFAGWNAIGKILPSEETTAELRWCYFGANATAEARGQGRIDRLVFGPADTSSEERVAEPAVLAEYCAALNMSAPLCESVSSIVFSGTEVARLPWDDKHGDAPSGGGDRSVLSPAVSRDNYSCMSLRFDDPPIPMRSDVSFDWSVGRDGEIIGAGRLQLFVAPPPDHDPLSALVATTDDTARFIEQTADGFSTWAPHSVLRVSTPIPELKWCYFGADSSPDTEDRGRIDRLRLIVSISTEDRTVIARYCTALNVPGAQCRQISRLGFAGPFRLAGLAWDSEHAVGAPDSGGGRSVLSPTISNSEYSCMSIYFDPPVPAGRDIAFDWDLNRENPENGSGIAFLRFYYFAPGGGDDQGPFISGGGVFPSDISRSLPSRSAGSFVGWGRETSVLSEEVGELRWCYFGANATAGDRDRGRIDRLVLRADSESFSERAMLEEYCAALNMSGPLCDRLSSVDFVKTGIGGHIWDDRHSASSREGDTRSVASPVVAAGSYSCMSLHFNPPIATSSDISFDWSLGRSGGRGTARLQLYLAPPPDHDPLMATTDTTDFIQRSEGGFSAWTPHLLRRVSAPVPELKWCYFGAGDRVRSKDHGRIDRLRLNVESSAEERKLIAGYCNALSLPEAHCERIDRIVFYDSVGFEGLAWDVSPEAGAPGGRDVSLVARRSSCMSLVFDPPWPPFADVSFWWDVGSSAGTEPAGLRLELNLDNENFFALDAPGDPVGGDRTRAYAGEGFAGWRRYRRNDFPEPLEQLRWCYRSGRTAPQPQDRARFALLQLQEDERLSLVGRDDISPYCEALNMPDWNCERIRYISFASGDQTRLQWDAEHPMGSPNGGGDVAVASPPVALGDYSCLSLHFDPPLAADSRLRFAWSAGRSGSAESAQMRLWLNPGYGHSPLASARGQVLEYDSGGAWQSSAAVDIDVAVEEAKWCVLGANLNPSPDDLGRLDAVRFGPYRELISERDRLDEYCAASGLEGMDCALLSRIVFSGAGPAESVWTIRDGDPYGLSSPRGSPGEESCMRMEFAAPAAAAVGRFVFGWSLMGPADSRLRVYRGGEARPVLEFAPSDAGEPGSFPTATVWVTRSVDAPNYLLSWCYYLPGDAAAGSVAARATVLGISLQPLRTELTVAAPMGGNRRVELTEHLAHALRVDISLGDVSETTQLVLVPATAVRLNSIADMVYQMSAGTLQPLDWRVSLEFGSHTSTTTLYLPQAVIARQQQFRLFSADGVLLATTTITVPAVIAVDSSATLAINRLCRGGRLLAAEAAMTNCPLLALPGNGFGDWMTASETASVTHLAPNSLEVAAVAGPSRCLRMLVGVSASRQERSTVQLRFRWRGPPPDSGVELRFYTGQSDVAVAFAPSSGMPVSGSLFLAQRPEGQQLRWCLEGSSSLASAMGSDWGWFPTDPDGFLLRAAGIAPLTVNMLLAALPYLQECTEQGRRPVPACLQMIDDVPESMKQHLGLADDVAITEETILLWSTMQWLTERGELDVNGDGNQDEQDMRLWLRYQAGLRGEALSRDPVDEAMLRDLLNP